MSEQFTAGEAVFVDRSLKAEFLRFVGPADANAIIRVGLDSRVVSSAVLSRSEA